MMPAPRRQQRLNDYLAGRSFEIAPFSTTPSPGAIAVEGGYQTPLPTFSPSIAAGSTQYNDMMAPYVLRGRTPEQYFKDYGDKVGFQGIKDGIGGAEYDPVTGMVTYADVDNAGDPFGPYILAAMAAGVGGLAAAGAGVGGAAASGGMSGAQAGSSMLTDIALGGTGGVTGGYAGLAGSGGALAGGTAGAVSGLGGNMDWMNDIIEQTGNFTGGEYSAASGGNPDAIELLINNLDGGMTSADAIKAVEASLPGSTQSTLQFLLNNPSQLLSMGVSPQSITKLLGGGSDLSKTLGSLIGAGLGAFGSNQQANSLRDIAERSRMDRKPFYDASVGWLQNPQSYYDGPGKSSMDAVLRRLSATYGNPVGSPTAMTMAADAGMRNWSDAVTGFGNLGLAGQDSRMSLEANAAGADANIWNAIGSGASSILNPQPSLLDIAKAMKLGGLA